MAVDIHLVSWNRPKMTELVIRAIHRNTKPENFTLHIIDNGSDSQTVEMLHKLRKEGLIFHIEFLDENVGLEWARQEMFVKETGGQYFIDADNDCIPPPILAGQDWVERLVELMDKYEDYAAISCRTQVMIGTGNIFEQADKIGNDLVDFPHPGGSLRIMRTNAIKKVGGWEREAPGRGAEERYIGSKLHEAGYKTAFAAHIFTQHLFGTRGDGGTDRWGYGKNMLPEETGHSDIWHPALANGDDYDEVAAFAGKELADDYYNNKT